MATVELVNKILY